MKVDAGGEVTQVIYLLCTVVCVRVRVAVGVAGQRQASARRFERGRLRSRHGRGESPEVYWLRYKMTGAQEG